MTDYAPVRAYRCKFSNQIVDTANEARRRDIEHVCEILCHKHFVLEEIKLLEASNNYYTDTHRAILFLAEIVKKKADEILAELDAK